MKRHGRILLAAGLVILLSGCGGSQEDGTEEAAVGKDEAPLAALSEFLNAVREGNDEVAEQRLTPLARKRTREANLVVTPPGRDTASFELGEVEWTDDETCHVSAKWTDLDHNGQQHTDEILWLVKHVDEGWCIAGMAAKPFEDLPRVFLNFEDPQDMRRQLETIEQEQVRRAIEQQRQQAQQPKPPGESTIR